MRVSEEPLAVGKEEVGGAFFAHFRAELAEYRIALFRRSFGLQRFEALQQQEESQLGIGVADTAGRGFAGGEAGLEVRQAAVVRKVQHAAVA